MLIQAAISRSREFDADAGGAAIAGSPHGPRQRAAEDRGRVARRCRSTPTRRRRTCSSSSRSRRRACCRSSARIRRPSSGSRRCSAADPRRRDPDARGPPEDESSVRAVWPPATHPLVRTRTRCGRICCVARSHRSDRSPVVASVLLVSEQDRRSDRARRRSRHLTQQDRRNRAADHRPRARGSAAARACRC